MKCSFKRVSWSPQTPALAHDVLSIFNIEIFEATNIIYHCITQINVLGTAASPGRRKKLNKHADFTERNRIFISKFVPQSEQLAISN